jgi:diacylglycerol kinase family enzyme
LDGVLDLYIFSELTKLELVSYAVQISAGAVEDPRILHYRVRRVKIDSTPPMPVMADGVGLGEGQLAVEIHPAALAVMSGLPPAAAREAEASRS